MFDGTGTNIGWRVRQVSIAMQAPLHASKEGFSTMDSHCERIKNCMSDCRKYCSAAVGLDFFALCCGFT